MGKRVPEIQRRARSRFQSVVGDRHGLDLNRGGNHLEPWPLRNGMGRELLQEIEKVAAFDDCGFDDLGEALSNRAGGECLERVRAAKNGDGIAKTTREVLASA